MDESDSDSDPVPKECTTVHPHRPPPSDPSTFTSTGAISVVGIINNYDSGRMSLPPIVETTSCETINLDDNVLPTLHKRRSPRISPRHKFDRCSSSSNYKGSNVSSSNTDKSRGSVSVSSGGSISFKLGNTDSHERFGNRKRSNGHTEHEILQSTCGSEYSDHDIADSDTKPPSPGEQLPLQMREQATSSILLANSFHRVSISFHQYVLEVTHSKAFNRLMLLIILVNALVIALESVNTAEIEAYGFLGLNEIFTACYTFEFIVKFYADKSRYWMSAYNLFDFGVLLVAYVDLALGLLNLSNGDFLSSLKSLRSFRALKIVSFIKGVQVIAGAIASTLKQLFRDVILLLFLLMFVFGVMGYYFFGYNPTHPAADAQWGTLYSVFLSLFTIVTADSWGKFIDHLEEAGHELLLVRTYIVVFLFIGHFIIANLFVAVIINNIQISSNDFKAKLMQEREILVQTRKREVKIRSTREVKKLMARANLEGQSNFDKIAVEFYYSLRRHDFLIMSDLKTNFLWMDSSLKEMNRLVKSFRKMVYTHRHLVADITPVIGSADLEIDSKKTSISMRKRYILKQRIGGLQLLTAGDTLLRRSFNMNKR